MTDITYERVLRQGAQRMAALLASELPETDAPPSPEFTRRMEPVVQQGTRRQSRRRMWQRTAAALVTVCLSCGVILAASPVARAAVSRWFVQITELVTAYRITPADAGDTVQDYTPTAPLGYVLSGDFTGTPFFRSFWSSFVAFSFSAASSSLLAFR